MAAANIGTYNVVESVHNSRKAMEEDSIRWASLPELGAECIECLVEELAEELKRSLTKKPALSSSRKRRKNCRKRLTRWSTVSAQELRDYINNERVILG